MKRNTFHHLIILSIFTLMTAVLTGCKPTEKHYKAAYDIARQKRESEEASRRLLEQDIAVVGSGEIQEVDGVRIESLGGEAVYTLHKRAHKDTPVAPYALVTARLGMRANAQALAEDHPGWRTVKTGEEYLVIAAEADAPEDILLAKKVFEKGNPDYKPLNLPGIAILIN